MDFLGFSRDFLWVFEGFSGFSGVFEGFSKDENKHSTASLYFLRHGSGV